MKTQKILVIDDQMEIINIIIDRLEDKNPNYVFYFAINGKKGIVAAQKHLPDLIITDWEMPGMTGIETIKALKSKPETKQIPVIMLTGIMTSSTNLQTALAAGAIDYIRKPIDELELEARVKSMLLLADSYNQIVDYKNRELASTAINMLQSNEFNLKIIEKINNISSNFGAKNKKLDEALINLKKDVAQKVKGEDWGYFESHFKKVHPDFSKNLLDEYPLLSPTELKLASFLRLKLTTKEISSITFLAPNSVKTARNRLRKKLNLSKSDNLTTFLLNY